MENIEIVLMENNHIVALASTHAISLPEDLLPSFGKEFMANVYYKSMLTCPYAKVFVALSNNSPVGFVTVSTCPEKLFFWLARNQVSKLMFACLKLLIKEPPRILELVKSLAASQSTHDNSGEIAFIAVDANYRRLGIGSKLINYSNNYLAQNNLQYAFTKTLSSNAHIVGFYKRNWSADIIDRIKIGYKEYVIISWPLNS